MYCAYCGAENPDGALSCAACGKNPGGIAVCPSCNGDIPAGAVFCTACGVRLVPEEALPRAAKRAPRDRGPLIEKLKKIFSIAAPVSAVCLAAAALIFVLFTGITVQKNGARELSFFYFFGDVYRDISSAFSSNGNVVGFVRIAYFLPALFGTAVSAATIAGTAFFSVKTFVCCGRKFAGKNGEKYLSYALSAFFVYVSGALCLLALNSHRSAGSVADAFPQIPFACVTYAGLNGAAKAGISVCAALAAVCLASAIVDGDGRRGGKRYIAAVCLSAAKTLILFFLMGTAASAALTMFAEGSVSESFNTAYLMSALGDLRALGAIRADSRTVVCFALSAVSFVLTAATLSLCGLSAASGLCLPADGKHRPTRHFSAVMCACCALNLILSIAAANLYVYKAATAGSAIVGYTGLIAAFVLAAAATGADILLRAWERSAEEEKAQNAS